LGPLDPGDVFDVTDPVTEPSPAEARAIIDANAYLTLATADGDGVPWASPVWFAHDAYAAFVWVSRPDARHSRNIGVRPEVGIVVFDSTVSPGAAQAVYAEAVCEAVGDADLDGLVGVYTRRASAHFVLGPGDRRLSVTLGVPG